jgi:hypothetical protein
MQDPVSFLVHKAKSVTIALAMPLLWSHWSSACLLPCPHAQGEAIAYNLREMFGLRVPIISLVIGEGGSGGALAIG